MSICKEHLYNLILSWHLPVGNIEDQEYPSRLTDHYIKELHYVATLRYY
jgi:hypothetical protein